MLNYASINPSLIKYMGSKSEIIDFIISGLNQIHKPGQAVCDLFSGSCTLASALRNNTISFYSNDIQIYSQVLARTYLGNYQWNKYPSIDSIISEAKQIVLLWKQQYPAFWEEFDYNQDFSLSEFIKIEKKQCELLHDSEFADSLRNSSFDSIKKYHLFTLDYSGTYWSFHQCIWIDSLRCVIDKYQNIPEFYNALLSCLMFAMAYNSQSTGHYAQFRKAQTVFSMDDILIYRRKTIDSFFKRKYEELSSILVSATPSTVTQLNYVECIDRLPANTLVYADPPYCFVHYSRFYHILETLVLYDYPAVRFDGRYRPNRHQSPFCISTKVEEAFSKLFEGLHNKDCELVLSYSNSENTMIKLPLLLLKAYSIFNGIPFDLCSLHYNQLEEQIHNLVLENIASQSNQLNISDYFKNVFSDNARYDIILQLFPHVHSRMGRTKKKDIHVFEALILARKKQN